MGIFTQTRAGSWTIFAGAIVVAAAAWGFYAWRHAGSVSRDTAHADNESPSESAGSAMVALRAERPRNEPFPDTASPREDEAQPLSFGDIPSGGITANSPPDASEPLEMTPRPTPRAVVPQGAGDVEAARAALRGGDLITARREYAAVWSAGLDRDSPAGISPAQWEDAGQELVRLADVMVFSRAVHAGDPLISVHEVAPGDTLYAVAGSNRVTQELLARINQLVDPHRLSVGRKLKVVRGPFNARISKSRHRLDVYLGDALVRSYRVGLGTNGGTPTGTWAVQTKLVNPDWTDPITNQHYLADDPDNPIGERWLGLEGLGGEAVGKIGFGIHGTIDPASIGQNMSMGCIRMTAEEVAEVYDLLVERHSRIIIH